MLEAITIEVNSKCCKLLSIKFTKFNVASCLMCNLKVAEYALDQIDLNDTSCHNLYDFTLSNLTSLIRDMISALLDPGEEVAVTETVKVDID